jgi:hypothetical protein
MYSCLIIGNRRKIVAACKQILVRSFVMMTLELGNGRIMKVKLGVGNVHCSLHFKFYLCRLSSYV